MNRKLCFFFCNHPADVVPEYKKDSMRTHQKLTRVSLDRKLPFLLDEYVDRQYSGCWLYRLLLEP